MVFATFHQTKGLERKVIIVFNFDDSYFKYYKKDNNPTICPNELYVAATRGIERLSLIHDQSSDYLPFLCQNELFNYCDMIGSYEKGFQSNKPNNLSKITSPTELLAHLPHHILEECSQLLKLETIRPVSNKIIIPSKTSKDICCEGVSELNGIAIPTYYEMRMKGKMNIYDSLKEINFPHIHKNHSVNLVIRKRLQDIDMKNLQCEDLLFIVNCWNCYTTNYLFKMYQIDTYDWMTHEKLIECVDRLSTSLNIPNTAQFEVKLTVELCICKLHIVINGFVDCIENEQLYEFKCVDELTIEHHLQLAIYAYLQKYVSTSDSKVIQKDENELNEITKMNMNITSKNIMYLRFSNDAIEKQEICQKNKDNAYMWSGDMSYYLYNILTDELIRLTNDMASLTKIMKILIHHKYFKSKRIPDEEFLSNIYTFKKLYFDTEMGK